jgi:nucleoside 2-deoxyribosyltransferase
MRSPKAKADQLTIVSKQRLLEKAPATCFAHTDFIVKAIAEYSKFAANHCPICKICLGQNISNEDPGRDSFQIDCLRCGTFEITRTAKETADSRNFDHRFSAWIRDWAEQGITTSINSDNLDTILKELLEYSPSEKQPRLLQNIKRMTEHPGAFVQLWPEHDFPLAWASGGKEFGYYIAALIERGYLKGDEKAITITAGGWDYLEKHRSDLESKTQAFVAMSFSDEMFSVWKNAIEPAIDKAGWTPYRVDIEPHIERIDVKIISEIKNSRFVVADVTERKRGVYYEAGYAEGLGLPVIWCVREDELEKVHFDTRQFNHIDWESEEELRETLYNFICAVIGKGPKSA